MHRLLAFNLIGKLQVGDDNHIHCCGHNMQLCLGDNLDDTKSTPPPSTKPCRSIIQKCHNLAVFIRGRNLVATKFADLASLKRLTEEGNRKFRELVLNGGNFFFFIIFSCVYFVDSSHLGIRWDSDLALLEHCQYFDKEIIELLKFPDLGLDSSCLLSSDEFDLLRLMVEILTPFQVFTKRVQHKGVPTLCYVPLWVLYYIITLTNCINFLMS